MKHVLEMLTTDQINAIMKANGYGDEFSETEFHSHAGRNFVYGFTDDDDEDEFTGEPVKGVIYIWIENNEIKADY